jgi:hypothetical protein
MNDLQRVSMSWVLAAIPPSTQAPRGICGANARAWLVAISKCQTYLLNPREFFAGIQAWIPGALLLRSLVSILVKQAWYISLEANLSAGTSMASSLSLDQVMHRRVGAPTHQPDVAGQV